MHISYPIEKTEKILIVDDEELIREMLYRQVDSFGYTASTAVDGLDAIEKLQKESFNFVITDMMMPNMGGMDLIKHINSNFPDINIIAITGYSENYSFNDIITAGATDFIVKPFEKVELSAKLQRLTRERKILNDLQSEVTAKLTEMDKLQTITSTVSDAILMMNQEGKITFWNQSATRIFGYSHEEVINKDLHSLIAPSRYNKKFEGSFQKFKETGQGDGIGKTIELHGLHKDGSEFPIELSLSSVKLNGQWHSVGLIRDITERKNTEIELLRAKNDAQQASKAKTSFINTMSHELRTPMNGIIGMTSLLLTTEITDTQRNYLNMAISASERLMNLINQLLDFSMIDSHEKTLRPAEFELNIIIENILKSFELKANSKGITISTEIDKSVPEKLYGDPQLLSQVLNNLLDNAISFTEQGSVEIKINKDINYSDKKPLYQFSVIDTGKGIPKDKQLEIFEAFTQVDNYINRSSEGAGLGLAICSKLVTLMGGEIWLESEPGKGSTFIFTAKLGT